MSIRVLSVVVALLVLLAGCAGQGAELASGEPSAAVIKTEAPTEAVEPEPTDDATEAPVEPEPTEEPTPEPDPDTPRLFKAGEVVTVTEGDEPWMDILVAKVSSKKSYGSGYFIDRPRAISISSCT